MSLSGIQVPSQAGLNWPFQSFCALHPFKMCQAKPFTAPRPKPYPCLYVLFTWSYPIIQMSRKLCSFSSLWGHLHLRKRSQLCPLSSHHHLCVFFTCATSSFSLESWPVVLPPYSTSGEFRGWFVFKCCPHLVPITQWKTAPERI